MSKLTFKQGVTFTQKGQIFTLHDEGQSLGQISEITRYNPEMLRWMIEGIKGTDTWFVAKHLWKEQEDERKLTNGYGETEINSTARGSFGRETDKKYHPVRVASNVSKSVSTRRGVRSQPRHVPSESKDQGRGTGDIVKSLRQHQDYVGE